MSEDRTQAPSRRRRQEARARGVAPKSPELTAAVGLLAAVALLGGRGGRLASGCVGLIRESFRDGPALGSDPGAVSAAIWRASGVVGGPLATIVIGTASAMAMAHLAQTGGLWAPGLLKPELARLVPKFGGEGPDRGASAALRRIVAGSARALAIGSVATWFLWSEMPRFAELAGRDLPTLAASAGSMALRLGFGVGLATLALGLIDYGLAWRRVEASLRQTAVEHKAESKDSDGDPELRSRRHRLARGRRDDPARAVGSEGAALVVSTGQGRRALAVLLGGERPPGPVSVRLIARGGSATSLIRAADRANLTRADAPALARWFSDAADARSARPPLPPELTEALAALWPTRAEAETSS